MLPRGGASRTSRTVRRVDLGRKPTGGQSEGHAQIRPGQLVYQGLHPLGAVLRPAAPFGFVLVGQAEAQGVVDEQGCGLNLIVIYVHHTPSGGSTWSAMPRRAAPISAGVRVCCPLTLPAGMMASSRPK